MSKSQTCTVTITATKGDLVLSNETVLHPLEPDEPIAVGAVVLEAEDGRTFVVVN